MIHTKDFLSHAIKLVGGDRQKDYGDKVENHNNIAKLWSAYLDIPVTAHDVEILMLICQLIVP